ncbi:MAG TPA: cupin domain-containing protein [Gammaproteobacteria bacterium]|nr:cupin domain-containing protein [Gammaproteobacteria bacterium]
MPEDMPEDMSEEVFELIVQSPTVKIERIISRGHSSPESGWYDQDKNEWIIVMKGEAIICFEGDKDIRLKNGSYLNIPAHSKHKVKWTDPDVETIWLAVYY